MRLHRSPAMAGATYLILFFVLFSIPLLGSLKAFAGSATDRPERATSKPRPEGGVELKLRQSPDLRPVPVGYIREDYERPRPASRLDVEPRNAGIAGAEMAIEENNAGGKLVGDLYSLHAETVSTPEQALETLQKFYEAKHNFIIVDVPAATLVKLADWAAGKDILLFNARAADVSLRQENCRANVMHVAPDRAMLADALAQFLVVQGWKNWLVVHGSSKDDLAYLDAVRRSANRFGANIVDTREYQDMSGGRRDDIGVIPPGKQASTDASFSPHATYDMIVVADEEQHFGPYLPYRGGAEPRPVAGTTGLIATTWSAGHEKWGATQANNNFQKTFKRLMLPIDYQSYVAGKAIGEAVTRNRESPFADVAAFVRGPELQLAPFKGVKQQFRQWDGQFRQPLLIATDKVPVSVSPQKGFPYASPPEIEMDMLGIDRPESICKM
jgi:ABC transporter substrate binding protein (PQQ-dependent alcohol dehydrogenase system)